MYTIFLGEFLQDRPEGGIQVWFEGLPMRIRENMLALPYTLRGDSARFIPKGAVWSTVYGRDTQPGIRDWIRRNHLDEVASQWWSALDEDARHNIRRNPRQALPPCSFGWSVPHPLLSPASCWPTEDLEFDAEYLDDDIINWLANRTD